MFIETQTNWGGPLATSVTSADSATCVKPADETPATTVNKPAKQFKRRVARQREMNPNGTISALGPWTRTVSVSDIHRFMECQGAYLMWAEGDKPGERTVGDAIGQAVHAEIAKPEQERLTDVTKLLKSVPEAERAQVAEQVRELIVKAAKAQDEDSSKSESMQKEPEPMVYFDSYTNTWWYAKPDVMAISRDERGRYLLIVDEKTTKGRRRHHVSAAFFFAFVARETKALGFTGTIKTVVRYLRDFQGNILDEPFEEPRFISGRQLSERQEQELHGIQATVKKMDEAWTRGEFELKEGGHCRGCSFRFSCPKNRQWLETRRLEQEAKAAESLQTANEAGNLNCEAA